MRKKLIHLLAFTSILFYFSSCSDKPGGTSNTTFQSLYSSSFVGCKNCHVPGGTATSSGTSIDFSTSTTAYNTLVGPKTKSPSSSDCRNLAIVVAGSSQTSYLTAVFDSSLQGGGFNGTSCAPLNDHLSYFSSSDLANLKSWINSGALNN